MLSSIDNVIIRERIIALFDSLADERIVYVCAPAGFGKTAAVRQWVDERNLSRAALALNEHDNNIGRFCMRFCAALCKCQPKNKALRELAEHAAFSGAPEEFTLSSIGSLTLKKRMAFIIDDLHLIESKDVLRLLLVFLKRLPSCFRIILISRSDLPAGFSDLWVSGRLIKVSSSELCFSTDEIMLLYKKQGRQITQAQAKQIRSFTDGWAIGIRAFILSGEAFAPIEYLQDYIRENIWLKWDEQTREFMLTTAILKELDPCICDTLTGLNDSESLLRELALSGAFIYLASDGIYHYHHLFHDFLKNMLKERGESFTFPLLFKEGQWHLQKRDFYRAAQCFIECKNHDGIARCFDLLEFSDRNDFIIERMLPIIKHPEVELAASTYPFLYYMLAWCAFVEARCEDMLRFMDEYYARYDEISKRDPAHAHNIFFMRMFDFRSSLKSIIESVQSLNAMSGSIKADCVRGSITMYMPLLHRSNRDFSELADDNTEQNFARLVSTTSWLLGEEANVLNYSLLAGLFYEQGRIEKAYTLALSANAELKPHFSPEIKFNAFCVLAYILDALGESEKTEQLLERISYTLAKDRAYYLKNNFLAMRARRLINRGDTQAASNWLNENNIGVDISMNSYNMYVILTACRAYICLGDYKNAISLLERVVTLVESFDRHLGIIESHILLSIAYWHKPRTDLNLAMEHLQKAVCLAHKHGYTRMFVNEGAELAPMLRRLHKKSEQPGKKESLPTGFIKLLYMSALANQAPGLTSGLPKRAVKLTPKQAQVMRHLSDGKSYKQIAQSMGIALPTLRSHIALIYKKLGVTSAADAIVKLKINGLC